MDVTIIIPAFNEEKSIQKVIESLQAIKQPGWEIMVVDDGSSDQTATIVKNFSDVRLIRHEFNKGYGASLKTGIAHAQSEVIVTFDADGQHDASNIATLVDKVQNIDMVCTARTPKIHSNLWRMPGKWFIGWLANYLSKTKIPDLNSGFRAFKKKVAQKYLHLCPNGFSISTTLTLTLLCEGYDVKFIPTRVHKRVGQSTVSVKTGFDTILLILRLIILFNPLRVFIPISFLLGGMGLAFFVQNVMQNDINDATVLLILSSILVFLFGLMADQMAHIRREIK